VQHIMRGRLSQLERGPRMPGEPPPLRLTLELDYYREEHAGKTVRELDSHGVAALSRISVSPDASRCA
jgi:phage tail tube protein FII